MPNIRLGKVGSRVWSGINNVWENVKNEIEIVQMNGESKGKWRLDRSGQFSVKSANNSLVYITPQNSRCWQDIWKIKISQRCKLQMWVILHNI